MMSLGFKLNFFIPFEGPSLTDQQFLRTAGSTVVTVGLPQSIAPHKIIKLLAQEMVPHRLRPFRSFWLGPSLVLRDVWDDGLVRSDSGTLYPRYLQSEAQAMFSLPSELV